MNPFMKLTKADFTLVDPQIRTGKGVKFSDVAGLKVIEIKQCKRFDAFFRNTYSIFDWRLY